MAYAEERLTIGDIVLGMIAWGIILAIFLQMIIDDALHYVLRVFSR